MRITRQGSTVGPTQGSAKLPAMAKSTRLRKSPFFEKTLTHGCNDFTVYNRMLMPIGFGNPDAEYRALTQDVAIWDVGAERQVELSGPDAGKLAQLLTCRDISNMKIQTCKYAVMCDNDGIVLNDPVLLKLSHFRYWFSLADSDALLWCKAHADARNMDVEVLEPDVSPLAIQGPKSLDLARELFGEELVDGIKYFHFREVTLDGEIPILLARSGWSPEHGYELYLRDQAFGDRLWDIVWGVGQKYGITPGAPNQQRRIEGGMLSFGGDTLPDTNALELGLPKRMVDPYTEHEFMGKEALQRIAIDGPQRHFVGIKFDDSFPITDDVWRGTSQPVLTPKAAVSLTSDAERWHSSVGSMTAAAYSPRYETNLGLAVVSSSIQPGDSVAVVMASGQAHKGRVEKLPFRDNQKVDDETKRKRPPMIRQDSLYPADEIVKTL